jgi:hypothetical protein
VALTTQEASIMRQSDLPPEIEKQAHEAILALASCKGLTPTHLETIRYCIAVCPEGFHRAYESYFRGLNTTMRTERIGLHLDEPKAHRSASGDSCCRHF